MSRSSAAVLSPLKAPLFGLALAGLGLGMHSTIVNAMAEDEMPTSAHAISFVSIDGKNLPMDQFAGKAVLVVNTASRCGFTPQYEGLQALWESYRDRGLVVLGVPSNDFGGQEPGSAAQIKEFCEATFSVDFPMTDKVAVKGEKAHPFYVWARTTRPDLATPGWNFHKYLLSPKGELLESFGSRTTPQSSELTEAVEAALADAIL
ncbi:MAG: glutathione peroxidase [Rhodospirillaceae bacterium]